MAVTGVLYGNVFTKAFNKEINYQSDNIKGAIVKDTYVPDQDAHQYWSDVVANETTGTGYTAGGAAFASKTVTYDPTANQTSFKAANLQWPASTITGRFLVIYDDSPATNATKPLLGYVDFGGNQSTSNTTFEVVWAAAGVLQFTAA